MEDEMLLIDVRTPEEYVEGHLKGAILIPHLLILPFIYHYTDQYDTDIALYCRAGVRSHFAQMMLAEAGFTAAKNIGSYEMLKIDYPFIEPPSSEYSDLIDHLYADLRAIKEGL